MLSYDRHGAEAQFERRNAEQHSPRKLPAGAARAHRIGIDGGSCPVSTEVLKKSNSRHNEDTICTAD